MRYGDVHSIFIIYAIYDIYMCRYSSNVEQDFNPLMAASNTSFQSQNV